MVDALVMKGTAPCKADPIQVMKHSQCATLNSYCINGGCSRYERYSAMLGSCFSGDETFTIQCPESNSKNLHNFLSAVLIFIISLSAT